MSFNYRMIQKTSSINKNYIYQELHTVYYDRNGNIDGWSENNSHNLLEIEADDSERESKEFVIKAITEAFSKPVLTEIDGKLIEIPNNSKRPRISTKEAEGLIDSMKYHNKYFYSS